MAELFSSAYVHANGLRFHYVENGPKDGPPVLLLHGFPEFWFSYRYQLGALGQAGYRAIAPDLRGYNLTDKPAGVGSYHIEKLLDDVVALCEAFSYKQVTLVGHDWGGAIAWAVASSPQHRHVVERLVILNSPHPAVFLHRMTLRQLRRSWYMLLFQLPFLPEHLLAKNNFANLRRTLRSGAHVPGTFSDEELEEFVQALARPGSLTAALNYYRAMTRVNPLTIQQRLVPVEAPTLLIWGERDPALGKELTYNLSGWVKDLRIEYLPDSGHWAAQEQPEQVNRLLLDFLPLPPHSPVAK